MSATTITVIGRADLGYSPHFGFDIRKGETYTIAATEFNSDLFEQPATAKTVKNPKGGDSHE